MNRRLLLALPWACASLATAACTTPHGHAGADSHRHGSPEHHGRMCAEYRQTMAGKSAAEQQAAAEAHVRAMHGAADAEHAARHLQMMRQRCGS